MCAKIIRQSFASRGDLTISQPMSLLHEPLRLGALTLPNRIIMAPLTRCRAGAGRVPNDMMVEY